MKRAAVVVGTVLVVAGGIALLLPRWRTWLREDRCLDRGGRVDSATGECVTGVAQEGHPSPREVVATLPRLDFEEQCPDGRTCDRTVEDRVFAILDSLGSATLVRGLPRDSVARILGPPPAGEGARREWADLLWGNPVEVWRYAASLSGTMAWVVVFVDGCVDAFGWMQQSWLWARWGRPEWSGPEVMEDYRFQGPGARCGAF